MRYRLRTLLVVLALGPPVMAAAWWLWHAMMSAELADISASVACGALVLLIGGAAVWSAFNGLTGRSHFTRFIAGSVMTFVSLAAVLGYFSPELGPADKTTDNLMSVMVFSVAGLVGLLAAVRGCGSRQRTTA